MNETLWEVARTVMASLMMMFILTVIIFFASDSAHRTQRESQFRTACEEVKGRVAWNGIHWECLK